MLGNGAQKDLLERAYACSCRVEANKARGSATIVYSKNGLTYALTNYHVIEKNISYKKVWDSLLKKDVKKEFTDVVEVMFTRLSGSRVVGYSTVQADIVLYDEQQDIALLKFRDDADYPFVRWYPREELDSISHLAELACVGAALGGHPIVTFGNLNGRQIEIDNYEYWMSSAPSIFGNSGGGVFALREEKWHFIGIPSRISVQPMGFSAQAITHMGFFAALPRIYEWLEDAFYDFFWDDSKSPKECAKLRKEKKEEAERRLRRRDE